MIKISKMADYAVVVLVALSKSDGATLSAAALAEVTRLPEPSVAKVLKLLARDNLVDSVRGVSGGYRLSRALSACSVADVILAIDGPVSLTACVEGSAESCDHHCHCLLKGRWDDVNRAIRDTLGNISLADMTAPPAFKPCEKKEHAHERL